MQPYFMPYIGYFQLINAVDKFVVYDNIEYTKKGWINRNRILVNGKDEFITIPLKKDSDFLPVNKRYLADFFPDERIKLLRKIKEMYRKAPCFTEIFPLMEEILIFENKNLFDFILHSLKIICRYLQIKTAFVTSSTIQIDHNLKSEQKVIAICKSLNANIYINPIGGMELYSKSNFEENKIQLQFLKSNPVTYLQYQYDFVPWLSIIDVLMFNSIEEISVMLDKYELISDYKN